MTTEHELRLANKKAGKIRADCDSSMRVSGRSCSFSGGLFWSQSNGRFRPGPVRHRDFAKGQSNPPEIEGAANNRTKSRISIESDMPGSYTLRETNGIAPQRCAATCLCLCDRLLESPCLDNAQSD